MNRLPDDPPPAAYRAMNRAELVNRLRDAVREWQATRDPRVKAACAERIAVIDLVLGERDAS